MTTICTCCTVDAALRSFGDDTILPADDLSHMERIK